MDNPNEMEMQTQGGGSKKSRRPLFAAIVGILLILALLLWYSLGGKKKLDATELYTAAFYGYDTLGTAEVGLDAEKLKAELPEKLTDVEKEEIVQILTGAIDACTVSPAEGLSNGDTVELSTKLDSELLKQYKIELVNGSAVIEVEGLTELTEINTAELLDPVFEGFDGAGKVSAALSREKLYAALVERGPDGEDMQALADEAFSVLESGMSMAFSPADHLYNKDEISATTEITEGGYTLESVGIRLVSGTASYTVEGLKVPEKINPTEAVKVTFEGVCPNVTVKYEVDQNLPYMQYITLTDADGETLDPAGGEKKIHASNGDAYSLTFHYDPEELLENGFVVEAASASDAEAPAETEAETEAETIAAAETEAETEAETIAAAETEAETVAEAGTEAETETELSADMETESVSRTMAAGALPAGGSTELAIAADPESETESEFETETETEMDFLGSETEAETEAGTETETEAPVAALMIAGTEAETATEAVTESEAALAETEAETAALTELAFAGTEAETETEAATEAEVPEAATEAEATSETETEAATEAEVLETATEAEILEAATEAEALETATEAEVLEAATEAEALEASTEADVLVAAPVEPLPEAETEAEAENRNEAGADTEAETSSGDSDIQITTTENSLTAVYTISGLNDMRVKLTGTDDPNLAELAGPADLELVMEHYDELKSAAGEDVIGLDVPAAASRIESVTVAVDEGDEETKNVIAVLTHVAVPAVLNDRSRRQVDCWLTTQHDDVQQTPEGTLFAAGDAVSSLAIPVSFFTAREKAEADLESRVSVLSNAETTSLNADGDLTVDLSDTGSPSEDENTVKAPAEAVKTDLESADLPEALRESAARAVTWNGHTYVRVDKFTAWKEAEVLAENAGGHLATVTTPREMAVIRYLFNDGTKGYYYLGATDEAFEGGWKWVTGEPFDWDNWNSGEPDNVAYGSETEDYLAVSSETDFRFSDFCDAGMKLRSDAGFIVEIDPAEESAAGDYLTDLVPTYAVGVGIGENAADQSSNVHFYSLVMSAAHNAWASYDLNGKYSTFSGVFSAGEESPADDQTDFLIWGDDRLLLAEYAYSSAEAPLAFTVDVTGVDRLVIETGIRQGSDGAFAFLSDAKLTSAETVPEGVKKISLVQPGGMEDPAGAGMILDEIGAVKRDAYRITADAQADTVWKLGGAYTSLDALLYTGTGSYNEETAVSVKITADGEVLYEKDGMTAFDPDEKIHLDLTGRDELQIIVKSADGSGNAGLYLADSLLSSTTTWAEIAEAEKEDDRFSFVDPEYASLAAKVVTSGDYRYYRFDEAMTYDEAKEFCRKAGGHLAQPSDADKNAAVAAVVQGGVCEQYWLGATGITWGFIPSASIWTWDDGSALIGFTNWAPGQPSNTGGNEHTLAMRKDGSWNDYDDNGLCGFLMEVKAGEAENGTEEGSEAKTDAPQEYVPVTELFMTELTDTDVPEDPAFLTDIPLPETEAGTEADLFALGSDMAAEQETEADAAGIAQPTGPSQTAQDETENADSLAAGQDSENTPSSETVVPESGTPVSEADLQAAADGTAETEDEDALSDEALTELESIVPDADTLSTELL